MITGSAGLIVDLNDIGGLFQHKLFTSMAASCFGLLMAVLAGFRFLTDYLGLSLLVVAT